MAYVCGTKLVLINSIFIFNLCILALADFNFNEISRYDVDSTLPYINAHASLLPIREKRDTQINLENQYQSIPQNVTIEKSTPSHVQNSSTNATTDQPLVVPYNPDHSFLVVNDTDQRKDSSYKQTKPKVVSDPTPPSDGSKTTLSKFGQYPKKVVGKTLTTLTPPVETSVEQVVDTIDVPENETLTELNNRNLTINQTTDHHIYYNSTNYINKDEALKMLNLYKNITHNIMLSQSHRRAMTVELTFDFPFYGHMVRNITVATGGFLYTGEYVHSWLAATQYIAPLMANFDTSLSNDSFVRLNDNGTAFTVVWENVTLQDKQDVGKFTFSTTLHKNGDIVFVYYNIPIQINAIQDDKHPVKVGLSDAYIIDKVVYFARRKTIYEYHRVTFASADITNSTIIYLTALPTCLAYKDCEACIKHETNFECTWCAALNRCSAGTDRRKHEWQNKGCERNSISDVSVCPLLGQKGNNANNTVQQETPTQSKNSNDHGNNHDNFWNTLHATSSSSISPVKTNTNSLSSALESYEKPKSMGLAVGFIVPVCLVLIISLWVLYAYRNPHTKSGQLLIQYRPSQWSWRRGEARYTAATIHM